MPRLVIVAVVSAIAVAVAMLARRRRPEAPTQRHWSVPQQLDRADFARPEAPWLVAAFTSSTCNTCADIIAKIEPLRSNAVSVDVIDYTEKKQTHTRYVIDAVPTVVIADAEGVVRASFVGPVTATDLWAAVAEAREPGSTPPPEAHTHR